TDAGPSGHTYICANCDNPVLEEHDWQNGKCKLCPATYSTVAVNGSFGTSSITMNYSDDTKEVKYSLKDSQGFDTDNTTGIKVDAYSEDDDIADVSIKNGYVIIYAVG